MMRYLVTLALLLTSAASWADQTLFNNAGGYGCVACHGKYAHGGNNAGGNIRGASLQALNDALANEPTMQLLGPQLSQPQRESLVSYLASLNQYQMVEWRLSNQASTLKANFLPKQPLQLIIFNGTLNTVSLDLSPLGREGNLTIAAYDTQSVEWQPNADNYSLTINDQQLVLSK